MSNLHLKRARIFAKAMDSQFNILGVRFGLDSIIGIAPGIGDVIGMFFSFYLVWVGYVMGLPMGKLLRMITNILIDVVLGTIPFFGDIADIFYKANIANLRILEFQDRGSVIEDGEIIEE